MRRWRRKKGICMFSETVQRWNWINAFLTASLHASISDLSREPSSSFSFKDFIQAYSERVRNDLSNLGPADLPSVTSQQDELSYIFHLESELWGHDWERYYLFFEDQTFDRSPFRNNRPILQTFHFVLAFYMIERCLCLFQAPNRRSSSRKGRRRDLFGYEDGVFSVRYPKILEVMGAPFYLHASTKVVNASSEESARKWQSLKSTSVPMGLQRFYNAVSRYSHFSEIIEASFISTRKTHLPANFKKNGKRLPVQTRAWWYDVLWKYSESIRYNPVLPSTDSQEFPFYWNRSIRWFPSLALTGLLSIAALNNPLISETWQSILQKNNVLCGLYRDVDRFPSRPSA